MEGEHGLGGKLRPLMGRMSCDGSATQPGQLHKRSLSLFCTWLNAPRPLQPAKNSSSAKGWLRCRAVEVKYYPPLPNPQANSSAHGGRQRKNDIMKPKRESKHPASSVRRAATDGLCLLCCVLRGLFSAAIKHGCAAHHNLPCSCFCHPGGQRCATPST